MWNDLRSALASATVPPPLADPLPGIRRQVARRRRRLLGVAVPAAAIAVTGAVWAVNVVLPGGPAGSPPSRVPSATPSEVAGSPSLVPEKSGDPAPADPVAAGVDADTPAGVHRLAVLVQAHPEAFVGVYRRADGAVVAVFGPDVDEQAWAVRLQQAAAGEAWTTARCADSRAALEQVRAELMTFPWPDGRPAFATVIRPEACAVSIQLEALSDPARAALETRYGRRVLVETGKQPTLR
jgi:hypothetical protein